MGEFQISDFRFQILRFEISETDSVSPGRDAVAYVFDRQSAHVAARRLGLTESGSHGGHIRARESARARDSGTQVLTSFRKKGVCHGNLR